jgi:hypothetical protein
MQKKHPGILTPKKKMLNPATELMATSNLLPFNPKSTIVEEAISR